MTQVGRTSAAPSAIDIQARQAEVAAPFRLATHVPAGYPKMGIASVLPVRSAGAGQRLVTTLLRV
jgi:hypothetical protein